MKKQNGFALVPILLILILLSVVGYTSYYVYNQQSSKKTDSAASVAGAAKTTPTPSVTPTTKQSATPTPDTKKYLVIKEWGVKMPINDEIIDLKYTISNGSVFLNTTKFAEYSNDVCPNPNEFPYLGGINRSNDINKLYDTPALKQANKAIKVGDYYYLYYNPTQMFCQHEPANQAQGDYFIKTQSVVESASNNLTKE